MSTRVILQFHFQCSFLTKGILPPDEHILEHRLRLIAFSWMKILNIQYIL